MQHARATAQCNVYYGRGRDRYDVPRRGRTAHESLFNVASGTYRGPSTQQGYSPFSTWTRGLAWAMLGFAEQIEFLDALPDRALEPCGGRADVGSMMLEAARATCDHYIDVAAADGVPYWDAGAPGLARLDGWRDRPADPFNDHEPVDSSAAAIAAQGLLRLGRVLAARGETADGDRYQQAGLRVLDTLFDEAVSERRRAIIRACCCTRSITGRTGGTTCRPARRSRAANRASGATTTRERRRSTSSASPRVRRI